MRFRVRKELEHPVNPHSSTRVIDAVVKFPRKSLRHIEINESYVPVQLLSVHGSRVPSEKKRSESVKYLTHTQISDSVMSTIDFELYSRSVIDVTVKRSAKTAYGRTIADKSILKKKNNCLHGVFI